MGKPATDSLVQAFVQASGVSFEGILDPYIPPPATGPIHLLT